MPTPTTGSTWSLFSPTGNAGLDALLQGSRWGPVVLSGGLNITYSFPAGGSSWSTSASSGYGPSSGSEEPWNNFHALTSTEQAQVRKIFAMISTFTKLTFTEVAESSTSVGDIRLAYSGAVSNASAAHAYGPSGTYDTSTLQGSSYPYAGDVWVNSDDYGSFAPTAGTYDYHTLIHEIGHALGLKHTFEADGTFGAIDPDYDSYDFSVMSYSAVAGDQDSTMSYYPATLMSYDVYALQYLYGKNTSYNAGNTSYTFSAGKNYNQVIWDAGGNDTIVYVEASTSACRINLNAGAWQDLGNSLTYYPSSGSSTSSVYNVQILSGVTIENATGGGGADTLIGNSVANKLLGGGGSDTLTGGVGNDTLDGGSGSDFMTGGAGSDTYSVNLSGDKVMEAIAGGTDLVLSYLTAYTLSGNVENARVMLAGSAALTGNALANTLYGGAGNNVLNGGSGADMVSYAYAAGAVTVSLTKTVAQATGGAGSDLISGCENLYGSAYGDKLTGSGGANKLYGAAGNDSLSGGAGNDTLVGGAGRDTLIGGSGNDVFDFNLLSELGLGGARDLISSFVRGQDKIDLSGIDASSSLAGDQCFSFVSKFSVSNATAQLVYATGVVSISTDADIAAEYQIELVGTLPASGLASSDFVL